MTSRDLVNIATGAVRAVHRQRLSLGEGLAKFDGQARQRKAPKVGHAGTLDPLADGVLVLGVGPASRLTTQVQQTTKSYRATFRLGCESPSGDLEETVTEYPHSAVPSAEAIEQAARRLTGSILQKPPAYSAIKVAGDRAYQLVRRGEQVEMPVRRVRVERLNILEYCFPELKLDIECGSGTYIRTLGMDLASLSGTRAVMTKLTRTAVGDFSLNESISVDCLREGDWVNRLIPAARGVRHLPAIHLDDQQTWRIDHGLTLEMGEVTPEVLSSPSEESHPNPNGQQEFAALDPRGRLRAIVNLRDRRWRPVRVFHDPAETTDG